MPQERSAADRLAKEIKKVAEKAKTEEDLRIGVEGCLKPILRELGIQHEPQYEKTILKGSADAVYGHVIIEYERPGKLSHPSSLKTCQRQVMRYLVDEASRYRPKQEEALKRLVGVGLDGTKIFFVRYAGKRTGLRISFPHLPRPQLALFEEEETKERFEMQGPYLVIPESIAILLLYLRALSRRPLKPETLAEAFGPKGEAARVAVNAFYQKALRSKSSKVQTLFAEWERIFGVVYGQALSKAEKDAGVLAKLYGIEQPISLKPLLFAVHTYFALLMKLLAAELASLQPGSLFTSFVSDLPALADEDLKRKLESLEDGGLFAQLGIKNFLEGDFFGWYLAAWDQEIGEAIRALAQQLSQFEAATPTLEPGEIKDLLKKLYQYLVPRELRHDLGEYYTPDWLAERLLNQVGYDGNPEKRVLDPACGSGTFLTVCIKRAIEYAGRKVIDNKVLVDSILKNIVGFDLNPLAVIAARTNYLLALGTLRRLKAPIEIPIYLCDSILTPTEHVIRHGELFPKERQGYKIPTAVGEFLIPDEVIDKEKMERLATLLEECVRDGYTANEFLARARPALAFQRPETEEALMELYKKVLELEKLGKNRIWARIIKNAFAPIFVGKFDYVVGNPPWVNWESLADEYRRATSHLWEVYGLRPKAGGRQFELGKTGRDISMLFVYVGCDYYLSEHGRLAYVITQTLFKTKAGEVFRKFYIPPNTLIKVLQVDDLVELKPFEDATNRTSIFACQKGSSTKYPVQYIVWRRKGSSKISVDLTLEEVTKNTRTSILKARPIDLSDPTSSWITAKGRVYDAIGGVLGESDYKAWGGTDTSGANSIYWVRILDRRPDGLVLIENLYDAGKTKVEKVQMAVEPTFLYPLLRGRDVDRWLAKPQSHLLLPHTLETEWKAVPEERLKVEAPLTFSYFHTFEHQLKQRPGYRQLREGEPFYITIRVGARIFAPYKVVWREQARLLTVAVIGPQDGNPFIPDHKLIFVPFESPEEAYYLAGVLNSAISQFIVRSYVIETQTSTHVLKNLKIPQYTESQPIHRRLADLSKKAHKLAENLDMNKESLRAVEEEIDTETAALWGISPSELAEIQRSLQELS